jgi:HEAT repeat protein
VVTTSLTTEDLAAVESYFASWWDAVRASREDGARPAGWKASLPAAPVAAVQAAALHHPDASVRRSCLGVLDHEASDESVEVFRAALGDPVPRVRVVALHGLACERCRSEELCLADVVPTLLRVLTEDPSPKVRHATIGILLRLSSRDERAADALRRAADDDEDELVRIAARAAVDGRFTVGFGSRKALRRRVRRG